MAGKERDKMRGQGTRERERERIKCAFPINFQIFPFGSKFQIFRSLNLQTKPHPLNLLTKRIPHYNLVFGPIKHSITSKIQI